MRLHYELFANRSKAKRLHLRTLNKNGRHRRRFCKNLISVSTRPSFIVHILRPFIAVFILFYVHSNAFSLLINVILFFYFSTFIIMEKASVRFAIFFCNFLFLLRRFYTKTRETTIIINLIRFLFTNSFFSTSTLPLHFLTINNFPLTQLMVLIFFYKDVLLMIWKSFFFTVPHWTCQRYLQVCL